MAKRKIYSAEELLYMDRDALIQIYNREAERRNKQITRARGEGAEAGLTGSRVSILKPGTTKSNEEIVAGLQGMYGRAELTKTQMVKDLSTLFGNDSDEFRQELNRMLKENPGQGFNIARKYADAVEKARTGEAQSWRDIYYQAMENAVDSGEIESESSMDKAETVFDYDHLTLDIIEEMLGRIQ